MQCVCVCTYCIYLYALFFAVKLTFFKHFQCSIFQKGLGKCGNLAVRLEQCVKYATEKKSKVLQFGCSRGDPTQQCSTDMLVWSQCAV